MPRGFLPREDTELVILRVAHNCDCLYEWRHHERIARTSGLSAEDVTRVRSVSTTDGWSERQQLLHLLGVYYTLRATAPHISHERGYALAISSLAAAVHAPLLGAYSASKAGVEALADSLRVEIAGSGARVGVAYFGELDTDMTKRGFGTEAAGAMKVGSLYVAPLRSGVNAIERGVARRSRRVTAPGYVAPLLPLRMLVQPVIDKVARRGLDRALEIARQEHAPLTTQLPD